MTVEEWTTEEKNDGSYTVHVLFIVLVLQFYGLSSLRPNEWTDVEEEKLEGSNQDLTLGTTTYDSLTTSLESWRHILRNDADPLGIKDSSTIKFLLNDKQLAQNIGHLTSYENVAAISKSESITNLPQPPAQPAHNPVTLSSPNFDARRFLVCIHGDTSFEELSRGRDVLRKMSREKTESLKTLVKQNFDRFVNAKNNIEVVFNDMQQRRLAERDYGLRKAIDSVCAAYIKVNDVYGSVLARRQQEMVIRRKLELFKQYEYTFELPRKFEEALKIGDYQMAASDYRRGKSSLQASKDIETFGLGKICQKVWNNVIDPNIRNIKEKLLSKLQDHTLPFEVHSKIIQALYSFDTQPDPAVTYFNLMKNSFLEQNRSCFEKSYKQLHSQQKMGEASVNGMMIFEFIQGSASSMEIPLAHKWKVVISYLKGAVGIFETFYSRICAFINALEYGKLVRTFSSQDERDYSIRIAEMSDDVIRCLTDALITMVNAASAGTSSYNNRVAGKCIVICLHSQIALKVISNSLTHLQQSRGLLRPLDKTMKIFLENASVIFMADIWKTSFSDANTLNEHEKWIWAGDGVNQSTLVVKSVEKMIVTILETCSKIFKTLGSIGLSTVETDKYSIHGEICKILCAFMASLRCKVASSPSGGGLPVTADELVLSLDQLSAETTPDGGRTTFSPEYKALATLVNLQYIRKVAIPHIFAIYDEITTIEFSETNCDLIFATLDSVEMETKEAYLLGKRVLLLDILQVGTIDSGIDWQSKAHLGYLRPYIYSILMELSAVQAEILDISTSIVRPFVGELVLDIFQELLKYLQMIREFGPGALIQLRSELVFLQSNLITIMSQEAIDLYGAAMSILTCEVNDNVQRQVDALVQEALDSSKSSFSCFQYN